MARRFGGLVPGRRNGYAFKVCHQRLRLREAETRISDELRRICIRGNNPGPLTRAGTNTWLLPGKEPTLIDAAEDSDEYAARVAEALEAEQPGAVLKRVLVTHAHGDHVAGIAALRRRWPALAFAKLPGEEDASLGVTFEPIEDEAVVRAGDSALWAIHTPGHAPDHVCYYEPSAAVLFCRRSAGERRHDHDSGVTRRPNR